MSDLNPFRIFDAYAEAIRGHPFATVWTFVAGLSVGLVIGVNL